MMRRNLYQRIRLGNVSTMSQPSSYFCLLDLGVTYRSLWLLTTRAKKLNKDDWGKLQCVLKYLKGVLCIKLTVIIEGLSSIKWWVNVLVRTHSDCKGHTGVMMSIWGRAVISSSRKQKITTKKLQQAGTGSAWWHSNYHIVDPVFCGSPGLVFYWAEYHLWR